MAYRRFLLFNVAGGVGWVVSMTWAGYLLGSLIPNVSQYVHVIVIVVIVLSCLPILFELQRARGRPSP
jgi:membrane-associated protein